MYMTYIIMGKDECNEEFRPNFKGFNSEYEAYQKLPEAREMYPEARSLWVELLMDQAYYSEYYARKDYWDEDSDPYDY